MRRSPLHLSSTHLFLSLLLTLFRIYKATILIALNEKEAMKINSVFRDIARGLMKHDTRGSSKVSEAKANEVIPTERTT